MGQKKAQGAAELLVWEETRLPETEFGERVNLSGARACEMQAGEEEIFSARARGIYCTCEETEEPQQGNARRSQQHPECSGFYLGGG